MMSIAFLYLKRLSIASESFARMRRIFVFNFVWLCVI